MKKGPTELVFILDRSGSMHGLEQDTIGGYNSMLLKQKEVEGAAVITTVLFDNGYKLLHDRIDIRAVSPITEKEYHASGATALLDAIGKTIDKLDNVQNNTAREYQAEKVMFVIITDGQENASRKYPVHQVKAMIEQHKKEFNWEFIFLGANIDAVEIAGRFGVAKNRAQNFHNDSEGIALNYSVVCETVAAYRAAPADAQLNDNWNEKIQEDFKKRSHKH